MSARAKLMVKLAQKHAIECLMEDSTTKDADPPCANEEPELEEVLMDIPLDDVFELPEHITKEIHDHIMVLPATHHFPHSEPVNGISGILSEEKQLLYKACETEASDADAPNKNNLLSDRDNAHFSQNELGRGSFEIMLKEKPKEDTRDEENSYSDTENDLSSNSSFDVPGTTKLHARRTTQIKRLRGQNYKGYKRSSDGKITHNIERNKRTMKNRCLHTNPKKCTLRSFRCAHVTEESRKNMFDYFWNLSSWNARKSFLRGIVTSRNILRRRKGNNDLISKKKEGHDCYISLENGEKVMVCRQMFLNTLDLGRDTFKRWCKTLQNDDDQQGVVSQKEEMQVKGDKAHSGNKAKEIAINWLSNLPKVPSHYCRSSSKKLYIESVFRSKLHVYQEYKKHCIENSSSFVSRTLFRQVFKKENIAIHKPRKDQCDTCCSWKVKNIPEQDYIEHIAKKNEAEEAKQVAKASASEEKLVVTMDLQSVLLAPKLEASAIYFKQKLQIHNFTVYSLNDKRVNLYVWHEANGNVTSNEFTSCIVDYIKSSVKKKPSYKHVVLISDGCGYQNRNKVLSSTLLKLAGELEIIIEQLILERGHTMMEADAVHSSLEAYFKPPIYAPSDYITRMRQARSNHPYEVHNIDYTFFLNYEKVQGNRSSIRPGRVAKVTDIRGILYLPAGEMKYKLRHNEEWCPYDNERERLVKDTFSVPQRLYDRPLKISKQKYNHLQELKSVMEKDYHPFYDSLPHNN